MEGREGGGGDGRLDGGGGGGSLGGKRGGGRCGGSGSAWRVGGDGGGGSGASLIISRPFSSTSISTT